jgi:hypothetical protein
MAKHRPARHPGKHPALRINELHTSDPGNPAPNPFTQNEQPTMPATQQTTVAKPNQFGATKGLDLVWASPTPPAQE